MSSGALASVLAAATLSCSQGADAGEDGASFGPGGGGEAAAPTAGTDGGTVGAMSGGGSGADGTAGTGGGDNGAFCQDADADGFGQGCNAGPDCDDDNPAVNPAAVETCDGVDENCNDEIDDGCECPDDGISGNCNIPTDLGPLAPGDIVMGIVGNIPAADAVDWYSVAFPLAATRPGEGTPTIEFLVNEDEQFVFDVMQAKCDTTGVPCTSGGNAKVGVALTSWSFADNGPPECCSPPMDSLTPWPDPVFVRVYRTTMGSSCGTYQLRVSR